jgi:predicted transcriptional regulator of viral defense system
MTKAHKFFFENQIFTLKQFATAMGNSLPICYLMLCKHAKTGNVVRIRNGLYASIPSGADPAKYPIDPYMIISTLADDTVIAYHSALQFHGIAYSTQFQHIFQSSHKIPEFIFRQDRFKAVQFPKLLSASNCNLYVDCVDYHGVMVRVTSKERTFVDALDRINLSGGLEEVWRSLDNLDDIDVEKVLHYALLLNNSTTVAKVGFYLQMHQSDWKIPEKDFDRLKTRLPKSTHYLDRSKRSAGKYIKEWRIIVPIELLNQSWEELLDIEGI